MNCDTKNKREQYALHHGLGSFLQARRETLRRVAGAGLHQKTVSVQVAQLGLHFLTPRDESETKTRAGGGWGVGEIIKWTVETAGFAVTGFGQQRAEADSLFVQPRSFGEGLVLELFPHLIQLDRLEKLRFAWRETFMQYTGSGFFQLYDDILLICK